MRNPIVERVPLTIVNLADFVDEQGNERVAEQLLRTVIRFVEALGPLVISPGGAEDLIEMAEGLINEYDRLVAGRVIARERRATCLALLVWPF
ncbi:hypothetical protein BH23CHL2_BH23CHL2_31460 [soil metagenome]